MVSAVSRLVYSSLGNGRNVQAALNAMRTQQLIAFRVSFESYARQQNASRVLAMAWVSVCLSVRLSYCGIVSKRGKLGLQNLHCGLPQGL